MGREGGEVLEAHDEMCLIHKDRVCPPEDLGS